MMRLCLFCYFLLGVFSGIFGQKITCELPKELPASSALLVCQNNFISINDSGNSPELFLFTKEGTLLHRVYIKGAKNVDWEALATDQDRYLYIGDIGNNLNQRKDLCIYRVDLQAVIAQKDTVVAEKIEFNYPQQLNFPPAKDQLYFDAEAMIVQGAYLEIFTKNRTQPFDGVVKIYRVPRTIGKHKAELVGEIQLGKSSWLLESVTDATLYDKTLFLLTYSKIYQFHLVKNEWVKEKEIVLNLITQKEGIAVDKNNIYMSDENENELFRGNFLYTLKR